MKVSLKFDAGTLLVEGDKEALDLATHLLRWDERVGKQRAQASDYAPLMRLFHSQGVEVEDLAKDFKTLDVKIYSGHPPMRHQREALDAWRNGKGRGMVVMPTGSGKSYFAVMAIASVKRSSLVVVPTIDLMQQWASLLERFLHVEVGMLGGGSKEIKDITVSTYDSAVLQMEFIGNKFGLAVYDECHHLPGQVNRLAASLCIAPYRLGLTATPEREDGLDAVMTNLLGPTVYSAQINDLEGRVLAPYDVKRIAVDLSDDEAAEYAEAHKEYTSFLRGFNISFGSRGDWNKFIALASRSPRGRSAFEAYMKQRAIARCGKAKLSMVWRLIQAHPRGRIIVFTADNETAYKLGELLCLPVLTHKTKAQERKDFLDKFRTGEYSVLITSKVLNEGVDVPEASVGIIVSGSASAREHVQRLGRILRAVDGKRAILYELVSSGTSEMSVSERRSRNSAYNRASDSDGMD